jgi:predicted flap endonuclease-1-like 5' DNA nuclease
VIWHFLEVWFLVAVSFAVGCALGAALYGMLADSPLALAQGNLADVIGDSIDWMKVRLGIGPSWRQELARSQPRQSPALPAERVEPHSEYDDEPVISDPEHAASYMAIALSDHTVPNQDEDLPEVEPPDSSDFAEDDEAEPRSEAAAIAAEPRPRPALPPPSPARAAIILMRPAGLSKPRGGVPDNLTRIRGIGQRNEDVLNSLGIFHFSQIAAWTPGEVLWIGRYLAFPERIERDDWVSQAMLLATGGDTGFEKSAERRRKRRAEERLRRTLAISDDTPKPNPPPSGGVDDEDQDED